MRIMELDRDDPSKVPTKVVAELVRQADGSVRATWHDENFREYIERRPPTVMGDDGVEVRLSTLELVFRYAWKVYRRSQVYAVISP